MAYDVAIVGGGVVGCAVAHHLSRFRARTVLLEREVEVGFGTSKANSGIIHSGHHAEPGTLKARLCQPGNRRWADLAGELGFGLRYCGDLTVALDDAEVPVLEELARWGEASGVEGLEIWGPERIRREEPAVTRRAVAALHSPHAAVVNPYEACFALVDSARERGVEVRAGTEVTGVDPGPDGLHLTATTGDLVARFVVDAAGLSAGRVADLAGAGPLPIRGRKGEEYLLDKRLEGIVDRIVFPVPTQTSKGILVIPTFDGTVMVGPTAEMVEDPDDVTTTPAGAAEVFAGASRLVPGISPRDCIAEFAGVRAVAPGEDFVIGPTAVPGFVTAAGIQSPGLTAAPAIAALVTELLADQGLELVVAAGRHGRRPARLPVPAGADDHVVCRCELVTEGDVLDAMAAGARTLDGLKFRTRAGMGRCQGGFCTWRLMQVLARESGIPMSSVTKRGPGSWIVLDRAEVQGGPS